MSHAEVIIGLLILIAVVAWWKTGKLEGLWKATIAPNDFFLPVLGG